MDRNIEFPAIAISKYNSFSVVSEVEASGNVLGWKKGYFEDLSYFDSSGRLSLIYITFVIETLTIFTDMRLTQR